MTEALAWERYLRGGTGDARGRDVRTEEFLVTRYAPLVTLTLARIGGKPPSECDREDRRAVCALALLAALRAYDPGRGCKFETFAIAKVRAAVLEHRRDSDELSRSTRTHKTRIADARAGIEAEGGEGDDAEVALRVGMDESHVRLMQSVPDGFAPFSSLDGGGESGTLTAEDYEQSSVTSCDSGAFGDPACLLLDSVDREALWRAVDALPVRWAGVVRRHFAEGATYAEIAREMGVSGSRALQMSKKSMVRLRGMLEPGSAPV